MKPFVHLFGDQCSNNFGPVKLKQVRDYMVETPNSRGEPSTRSHINKQIARIVRAYRWATENELVDPTILLGLQAVPGTEERENHSPGQSSSATG